MKPGENAAMNAILRSLDEDQVAAGLPIVSILVLSDDGSPCSVALESIERYKLRLPNESDAALFARLREESFASARKKH